MDVVGLISGGKDSIYNLIETRRLGHRVVCLANLHPAAAATPAAASDAASSTAAPQELDSFMFQTVGHNVIGSIAQCMGLPLVRRATAGKAVHQGIDYPAPATSPASVAVAAASQSSSAAGAVSGSISGAKDVDEVEDLYQLLSDVVKAYPSVKGVSCGAILSNYQRARVEDVCGRVGLTPLSWLWQREQGALLQDMVDARMEAVIVKVASFGLTRSMLGRSIGILHSTFPRLASSAGLNVCGEGGEYETITLDCPLYTKRIVIDGSSVVDVDRDVAHLVIEQWHTEDKTAAEIEADAALLAATSYTDGGATTTTPVAPSPSVPATAGTRCTSAPAAADMGSGAEAVQSTPSSFPLIRCHGDQIYVSGLTASSATEGAADNSQVSSHGAAAAGSVDASVAEVHAVLQSLCRLLFSAGACTQDVLFVHLYLADMSHFHAVNGAYCQYFGAHPPSRSAVQARISLLQQASPRGGAVSGTEPHHPPSPAIMLDCIAHRRSGAAVRSGHRDVRSTLHVSSVSRWAPLCIGPYCQANTIKGCLLLPAGQIGMHPSIMAIPQGATTQQHLVQALRNLARCMAACDSGLPLALSLTVYVAEAVVDRNRDGTTASSHLTAPPATGAGVLDAILAKASQWVTGLIPGSSRRLHEERLAALSTGGTSNNDDRRINSDSEGSDDDGEVDDAGAGNSSATGGVADGGGIADVDEAEERMFPLGEAAYAIPLYLECGDDSSSSSNSRGSKPGNQHHKSTSTSSALTPSPEVYVRAPVHIVIVPHLPRGADVEVEAVALTQGGMRRLAAAASSSSGDLPTAGSGATDGSLKCDVGTSAFTAQVAKASPQQQPEQEQHQELSAPSAGVPLARVVVSHSCHYVTGVAASTWVTVTAAPSSSSTSTGGGQAVTSSELPLSLLAQLLATKLVDTVVASRIDTGAVMHLRVYAALPSHTTPSSSVDQYALLKHELASALSSQLSSRAQHVGGGVGAGASTQHPAPVPLPAVTIIPVAAVPQKSTVPPGEDDKSTPLLQLHGYGITAHLVGYDTTKMS